MKLNNIVSIFIVFFLAVLCDSCYKHEEGCRDTNALNYDVMADVDCEENCCNYPKVSMDFKMYIDTMVIDTSTYFSNFKGDSLRIRLLRMYFSDFSLMENTGEIHPLYNEVILGFGADSIPDFKNVAYTSVKISEKGGAFEIGTLDKLSIFNKINFVFGIDSIINHSSTEKITTSSYLHQFSDSMYVDRQKGYYFLKLIIDTKDKLERVVTISGDDNLKRLSLNGDIDFQKRENHKLPIKLDMNKWLYNIDFINSNDAEISQVLMQNLNLSLQIREE